MKNGVFMEIYLGELPIGYISFSGKDLLPSWAITHYLEQFCINHMKLVTIQKICYLASQGVPDSIFYVSSQSAEIYPNKLFKDKKYDNTIGYFDTPSVMEYSEDDNSNILIKSSSKKSENNLVETSKNEDAAYFWYIIQNYKRPIVLIKDGDKKIPLYDFSSNEATKIWNLKVQSPPEGIIRGALGAAIDLVQAHIEDEREKNEYINRQLGQSVRNLEDIVRASQCINNPNTPEGVRAYANQALSQILKRQADINNKIGITNIRIDTTI